LFWPRFRTQLYPYPCAAFSKFKLCFGGGTHFGLLELHRKVITILIVALIIGVFVWHGKRVNKRPWLLFSRMMSFLLKGTHSQTRFKWPWRSQSPLAAQLLADPEIELSDYRRLPSSGSESPSQLLHAESFKKEPIPDLDIFFERLYEYFCAKGLKCIITKWIIETLNVLFMVSCIGFFFLFVDWSALGHLKCGVEALESGEKPCDLIQVIKQNPLAPFTLPKMITVGSMVILTTYGLTNFLKFFVQLKCTLNVRQFYNDR
jgi:autophagy-related protein 9